MSGYWIFAFGCVVGGLGGLLVVGLLGMAHQGDVDRERVEAYYRGVEDGKAMERIYPESHPVRHFEDHIEDHIEDPEIG